MPIDLCRLDQALDKSLEAAVDASLWPQILDSLTAATGSFGANIIPANARSPDLIIATESVKPALEDYFANGWHINEWRLRGIPLMMRDGTMRDQQYTTRDQFEHLEYYRFQAEHGIGRTCIIGFSSPEDLLCLTLHRTLSSDVFSDEEAAVLQNARERLMASAMIMRGMSASRIGGMVDAFRATGVAAIFFDRLCRVTEVTPDAERLFGDEIYLSNRTICSRVPEVTTAIQKRMRSVTTERWLRPDEPSRPLTIPRDGMRPMVLRIQRLGGNLPDFFAHSVGVCLIEDVGRKQRQNQQQLRQLFGLTATEATIATMISQGMTLQTVAKDRSISYETARTHLRSIFSKTNTGRQAELATLLTRLNLIDLPASDLS
ncbi:helix-turn-helix transcriptional regulator [Rhizobium sp. SEMIA 4085]|uniref:LuxR family transcriptional regulator protein n=1 Tax=Rhizobium gallicum bv. gallicum R602sp TaxID=1041138 RepID=A0A0B4X179_9HYPH|nr:MULTISPECIES: helix-turn-helix transcriptional regulator [Rhizobium]AJD41699.1 LuxR family transcriptional regulator protein [Rhizobium gallicum bv. gallicum R602sp]NNH33437.1 helix-turn-helix transcriptional regulator [Rhizobium sp. SEMIA 4085]